MTSKARHKRAMVAHGNRPYPRPWAHILGQRHNAAVEAIISIHDDNVAEKVVEAEAAAASKLKKHQRQSAKALKHWKSQCEDGIRSSSSEDESSSTGSDASDEKQLTARKQWSQHCDAML